MEGADLKHVMLLVASLGLSLAAGAAPAAQSKASNDPSTCPYCEGDPELMAKAGIVSHGGFEFGTTDTAGTEGVIPTSDIRWIETEHFELGFALGSYKVTQSEKKKIRAELTELAEVLPAVQPKEKVLDPWLRTHLFAQRLEKTWDRFLEIMQVSEDDFPDADTPWMVGEPYRGEGPYLGQKGKYEVLVVPTEAVHVMYLRDQFGLSFRKTQRWNVVDRDTLTLIIHAQDGDLRVDTSLHGHVVFNLAINMLDGYKHYSYDTPNWIREGLAHFMEREISTEYNSFDSGEGAIANMTRKSDWIPEVKKMIRAQGAPRMAELLALRSFAEFELEHHFATWSMTVYLIQEHAAGYACLNDRLHGLVGDDGIADSSKMEDKHRDAFKECLGMSYVEFDRAWAEWALAQ